MTLEQLKSADGEPFRQLFAIYAASITPREQKPEDWLRAMVAAPEYRVWIAQDAGHVLGFSILFVPPGEGFALLEYMAVAAEKRGHGFGGELFRQTVEHALTPQGAGAARPARGRLGPRSLERPGAAHAPPAVLPPPRLP